MDDAAIVARIERLLALLKHYITQDDAVSAACVVALKRGVAHLATVLGAPVCDREDKHVREDCGNPRCRSKKK